MEEGVDSGLVWQRGALVDSDWRWDQCVESRIRGIRQRVRLGQFLVGVLR